MGVPDRDTCEAVAFVGNTLAPFFDHDPKNDLETLEPMLNALNSLDVREAAGDWPFAEPLDVKKALSLVQDGLSAGFDDPALYREYRRLFVGPTPKVAPPWGSVYTDRDMVFFGESELDFERWLVETGISFEVEGGTMPKDHIATMLSLMAWIAIEKPEVLEEYLRLHLLTWAGHFFGIVVDKSTHPFYIGIAALAKASLEGIQKELGIKVKYPRYYR